MMTDAGSKMRLLLWLLVISFSISYVFLQLRVVSDIGQFMPEADHDSQLQALMSEVQNGPAATTLMLRLSGANETELAELSVLLSRSLTTQAGLFRSVLNSNTSLDNKVVDALFPYRYLLGEKQDWSKSALKKNFEKRLVELRFGAGSMLGDFLTSDPQLVFIRYLHGLLAVTGPVINHGVWFDKKQESALLLVAVRSESLNLDIMQRAVENIQHNFAGLAQTSSAQLEIAGPGIMAVETRANIEQVVTRLSVFITVLLIIVFVVAYRSLLLLLLAFIPLISAVVAALAVTQMMFHQVHGIVLAFGITLLGVCIDYPLHLFSHLRRDERPRSSLDRIWPTLFLSGVSSILAYLALLGSGFNGLSQLAVFAATGLTVALVVTRYLLPDWVSPDRVRPRLWAVEITLSSAQKTGLAIVLLCLPILIIVQTEVIWETSIDAISPVPAAARESDGKLRHQLNVPEVSHVFMQTGNDVETVLQASEHISQQLVELQTLGIISRIWSPSQILPSVQRQRERQQLLPTKQQLSSNMETALIGLPFRALAFTPWIESVIASHDLKPVDYDAMSVTPLATVLRQGLFRQDDLWVATIRISGVRSNQALNDWLALHPDVEDSHIEIKQATQHLLAEYRISTFERFLGVIMVLIVIILFLSRSVTQTLWILLPVSIGLLAGFALPLLTGVGINVFHLLALLLVLGMGLDYSLFFNRVEDDVLARQQNIHAITISALTTSAAFSVLAFSSIPVMAAMGQTVATGVFMCFISAWLLTSSTSKKQPGYIK